MESQHISVEEVKSQIESKMTEVETFIELIRRIPFEDRSVKYTLICDLWKVKRKYYHALVNLNENLNES